MTRKRQPGTGTVQLHNGRWRLRLPRSLDPSRRWLKETFAEEQKELAHQFMDLCISEARKRQSNGIVDEGITLRSVWPRYVSHRSQIAGRRHGSSSATKTRSRIQGMGENWLSKAPFWNTELTLITGASVRDWLEDARLTAVNAKGQPISDSWVSQMAGAIRGAFQLLRLPAPIFEIELEYQKVQSALNLNQQARFFQQVLNRPLDRVMAGCQMGAGLRIGELLSLKREYVDIESSDPHIMVVTGGPDDAPTKSGQPRRVELFGPGLGFFKMALRHHHQDNRKGLLFSGPNGGYLGSWPERFVEWSELMGEHITSHDMRHTWAFSMLSGLWGHQPQDITFVSRQLGHTDIRTTQRAYGHWDPAVGVMTARHLRGEKPIHEDPITAEWLLGEPKFTRSPPRSPRCRHRHRGPQ